MNDFGDALTAPIELSPAAAPPPLRVLGASKRFGAVVALDGVELEIGAGEIVALLGGSGCGKSTLLRVIAGFTRPDAGRIIRAGEDITATEPAARRMGFVFQSYALFPTKTVAENIGFALRIRHAARADIDARVRDLAGLVEIGELLDRMPHELSGGQQQRVALARALAPAPDLLLLDEPLSALDARIRVRLRDEIRSVIKRVGATAIYVTHDQEEALAIAERVAVMDAGRIVQIDTPARLYDQPATRFIAGFLGIASFLPAMLETPAQARLGRHVIELAAAVGVEPGESCLLAVRPEQVRLLPATVGDADGIIIASSFLGATHRCRIRLGQGELVVDVANEGIDVASPGAGDAVALRFAPRRIRAFAVDER